MRKERRTCMENNKSISVMVCYAQAHQQDIVSLTLSPQTKALQAIQQSGILDKFPEIDLSKNSIGIFGKIIKLDQVLRDRDRIEIYRPLHEDPMQARRRRAEQQKN